MTRLASQWATDGAEVSPPAEKNNLQSESAPKSASQPAAQTKSAPFKLDSKWANTSDPEPQTSRSPRKTNSQIPTPPRSSGKNHSDRGERRRSEGKLDHMAKSHKETSHSSHKTGESSNNKSKHNTSESGPSLASRIENLNLSEGRNQHNNTDAKLKKGHTARGPRRFSNDTEEYPKGPMTAAAKSFASRLGVPENSHKPSNERTTKTETSRHNVGKSTETKHNNAGIPVKPAGSTSKYMTPKQKRALEDEKRQKELAKEQELKEAKLKEEVREMFEKMSDKSTSWADLEDE